MEGDWKDSLSVDDKGNLTKSISNYRAIFTHDENLSQIRFDTFCQDDISFSPLFLNVNGNKVDEESVGKIQDYLEQTYQLRLTQNKVFELLKTTASERSYNPVQEFIRKEMWDGMPRIETAIIELSWCRRHSSCQGTDQAVVCGCRGSCLRAWVQVRQCTYLAWATGNRQEYFLQDHW